MESSSSGEATADSPILKPHEAVALTVTASKLAPGPHSVRVEMYDTVGNLLPRMTNTYYGLSAPKEGEACFRVGPVFEGDNQLPEAEVKKALNAGVKPGYVLQY